VTEPRDPVRTDSASSPHDAVVPYATAAGILVTRTSHTVDGVAAINSVVDALDSHKGVMLGSGYEYPGRYTKWDIAFVRPPVQVEARGRRIAVLALNARGRLLLRPIAERLRTADYVSRILTDDAHSIEVQVAAQAFDGAEEQRSRQPTVFAVLRTIIALFEAPADPYLGLYGAFGYDLARQFEDLAPVIPRDSEQRDLVLYLPDELVVVNHSSGDAHSLRYDFRIGATSTDGLPRDGAPLGFCPRHIGEATRDHRAGEFARLVEEAKTAFHRGDLFEVVPSQTFTEPCSVRPSAIFRGLRETDPAPFATLMNLGAAEYLTGASPEMFVRVSGRRVETSPISGTIARGGDAVSDADQILRLLASAKDAAELTMCTDVDRNDKSRICEPGSVRILGRRQIELYSRVIHTVDHVEGRLREGFDALDAFMTHVWAVTVTGAPKLWAMRFIEQHEKSPRRWYGGAIGYCAFDGSLNTGITLRTIQIRDGYAQVRAGGTLLVDSVPQDEEAETELKASAFLAAIRRPAPSPPQAPASPAPAATSRVPVLLLDYEDSFVHTLANYMRQCGATVLSYRATRRDLSVAELIDRHRPKLVVLSPGPGTPQDFHMGAAVDAVMSAGCGLFGVCLGFQAIVERFGGKLHWLDHPAHGRSSPVRVLGGRLFEGIESPFQAGRYHSIFVREHELPDTLVATAVTDDGVLMGFEHRSQRIAGVQFHPESLMTMPGGVGLRIVANAIAALVAPGEAQTVPAAAVGADHEAPRTGQLA
jgi:anthranilate synthase